MDPNSQFDMNNVIPCERHVLYCIPIPGETKWSILKKEKYIADLEDLGTFKQPKHRVKRGHEEILEGEETSKLTKTPSKPDPKVSEKNHYQLGELNFPLPNMHGLSSVVKVYGDMQAEQFKLNDVFEFTGFFYLNDTIPNFEDINEEDMDSLVSQFPGVPIIHCIDERKIVDTNPYIPLDIIEFKKELSEFIPQIRTIRQQLINVLKSCLGQDLLAAEYLLYYLLSRIYYRQTTTHPIGHLPLNFIIPDHGNVLCDTLYPIIQNLTCKCHMIPLTLENLASSKYIPHKDYTQEKLITGELQLSSGTHILINEVNLEPGQLSGDAVKQIHALEQLVAQQIVSYDFQFHSIDMMVDTPILIVSNARSIFKTAVVVRVSPQQPFESFDNALTQVCQNQSEEVLSLFRKYIGMMRHVTVNPTSDEITEVLQNDFVNIRQENPNFSDELYGHWLNLSKLVCLSFGEDNLNGELWEYTKKLEGERILRMMNR